MLHIFFLFLFHFSCTTKVFFFFLNLNIGFSAFVAQWRKQGRTGTITRMTDNTKHWNISQTKNTAFGKRGERKTINYTQLKISHVDITVLRYRTCFAFALHFYECVSLLFGWDCIVSVSVGCMCRAYSPCTILISVYDYQIAQSLGKREKERTN